MAFTPARQVLDANGSPVLAGVSGTMSLFSPTSATALATGAVASQGKGFWGTSFPAANFANGGVYTWNVPTLTVPGATYTNWGGAFSVGPLYGWERTLRDLLVRLATLLRDGVTGTATGGSTTTLVDSKRAFGALDDWVGTELYVLAPGATTDINPVVVTAFNATNGTFTFVPAVTAITSGTDYLLANIAGKGWPHEQKLEALKFAYERAQPTLAVVDDLSLATSSSTEELALPANWVSVSGVSYRVTGASPTGNWRPIAGDGYTFYPSRRTLRLKYDMGSGYSLRLEGRVPAPFPTRLGGYVDVPPSWLLDAAMLELLAGSGKPEEARKAQLLASRVERYLPRRLPAANEVRLT